MTMEAPPGASPRPRLALASNNPGKIEQFHSLLGDAVDIVTLADFGLSSPEETGATFEENATIKARFLHEHTGLPTLADDSGLEVDALDGAPGVRSARFAGEQSDDAANRRLLLSKLSSIPNDSRGGRFVAVIALIDEAGHLAIARGACEGRIAHEERGTGGFGYDAIFQFPDGRTMAQLSPAEKNAVSHRGHALREILPMLRRTLGADSPEASVLTS